MAHTALLAGATGLVGREVLGLLTSNPRYSAVKVLSRSPLSRWADHPKVSVLPADFENPASRDWDSEHVFCALGTTLKKAGSREAFRKVDYEYVRSLAACARETGARKFIVVSAMGADAHSRMFYNRVKGEMEATLKSMSLPGLHILRPSLLDGDREERRPAEKASLVLARILRPVLPADYRPVQAKTVAEAMVALALSEREPGVWLSGQLQRLGEERGETLK